MAFKDRYPRQIEFEIDRRQLLRYWRLSGMVLCGTATLLAAVMIDSMLFATYLESHREASFTAKVLWFFLCAGASLGGGLVVAGLIYLAMFHLPARRAAQNLRLLVEGPYLRIVSGGTFVTDERIHFRSISSYSTHEGPLLRKLGLKSLSFRVGHSRDMPSTRHITGLVNPDDVRDQLCEIDAARENAAEHE